MFLSRTAHTAYAALQDTLTAILVEKPIGSITDEHYDAVRELCSAMFDGKIKSGKIIGGNHLGELLKMKKSKFGVPSGLFPTPSDGNDKDNHRLITADFDTSRIGLNEFRLKMTQHLGREMNG